MSADPPVLVDCFPLRDAGRKLDRGVIIARGPRCGWLHITRRPNRSVYPGAAEREPVVVEAVLLSKEVPRTWDEQRPMLAMSGVVVFRRTAEGVLLHGREGNAGLGEELRPQAWWCVFKGTPGGLAR
jgi:hypothetical protein